ncbi:DnaD domain protein [Floricoccus penangensis]|uniref:DnaD domain protein n=1 Tax=Floricoccus penangensis TaxID=1859475 RepID=UPI0009F7207A|nr:DnaD domain protein [Floricoccus penangensis]
MQIRPADQINFINKNRLAWSADVLMRFYLPIIGRDAVALYQYLTTSDSVRVSDVLNHLNIGIIDFNDCLDKLTAMNLLDVYTDRKSYQLELKSPKNPNDFLADEFYSRLLLSRVGEQAFEKIAEYVQPFETKLSKKFSDVFKINFSGTVESIAENKTDKNGFDLTSFQNIMRQRHLGFANKEVDVLRIYELADKYNFDWYDLFKIAEKTANANSTINIDAIILEITKPDEEKPDLSTFSPDERQLIMIAKEVEPEVFLNSLKSQEGGFVTKQEREILLRLTRLAVEPEVQNILIHYSLIQTAQSSLNEKFVDRVANDWKRNNVSSAELALKRIESFKENQTSNNSKTNNNYKQNNSFDSTKSSAKVPEWHNETTKNMTTDQDLLALEKLRQEALKDIQGVGD